jgi:hypothetical protein
MTFQFSLQYGEKQLVFDVKKSDRKTIEISVHPDKHLIVKAPKNISQEQLEKKLRKRASWVIKKLRFFDNFELKNTTKNYIGGETHLYLGRQYRLKVSEGTANDVKLTRGFFEITCKNEIKPEKVKQLLDYWYRAKSEEKYNKYMEEWWPYFDKQGFTRPDLKIRKMKTRWGSLSKKGNVTLNIELIKAPKECIKYVIVHELCHLQYHNHGSDFYSLLEKLMPDWKKRKQKLEMAML